MDNTSNLIRQMPVSIEAEQALLGSIIIRPESFDKIGGMVEGKDADIIITDENINIIRTIKKGKTIYEA